MADINHVSHGSCLRVAYTQPEEDDLAESIQKAIESGTQTHASVV